MYFPYLRGRQYELLALRELVVKNLLGNHVIPIVEPVKLSPTLTKTMAEYVKAQQPISVIRNPLVGSFLNDLKEVEDGTKEASYKVDFQDLYNESMIIKSIIMQENAESLLRFWEEKNINKDELLVINVDREYLDSYEHEFESVYPQYVLIPDETAFRRRVRRNRVILDDKFARQSRNVDYQNLSDEFFSDDHLYYKEDGLKGFSDYSIVGNEYLETGFAPYAVAIHIVYFAHNGSLRVKHFVSDSNEDITNPAKKFYEAVSKLVEWYNSAPPPVSLTTGLQVFLDHFQKQTYPGLGSVKKLSIMHHLELMGNYLNEV